MSEFGEILNNVGEFGAFQKRLLVLICIPYLFTGFHLLAQVFTGATVQHHCQADWILNVTDGLSKEEQLLLTIPKEQDGSYQKCKMYTPHPDKDINWILLHGNKSTIACEEGWAYDLSQHRSTIVTEFNLVCDHRWLSQFSQTSTMAGLIAGALLFGPLADRLLPESARWLITKGQKEAAKEYLRRAAIINRRAINESLIDKATVKEIKPITFWDLFRISSLRRVTLVLTYIWSVNSFVYYGLCFSVGSFGKNIYLTNFIFGLVEILRFSCIWFLARFGRKKCQGCFLLLGGVTCLLILTFPEGMALEVTVLAVLAKLSISCSFSVTYVYSTELFPTVIRQTGIGFASMFARLGGTIVPLIMILEQDYPGISLILFGITSIIASALSLLLPETANKELPDHTGQLGNVKKEVNGKSDVENACHQSAADAEGNFTMSTRM
ncbi:solute carrier family 22 member 13b isoform X4 [Hemitrygon akajei]|uniref:solute carrier family 22 member 13b isoform X4 n=1 Tax=Hemitrygon akajei TaxID=2704970 RepID=UPI003BF9D97C